MSREWHEHKYCSAENLWLWIDEEMGKIDQTLEGYKDQCGDSYKLVLMSRREMIDKLADWLHEESAALGEIAQLWGLGEKDENC
jgi:hypothetical protein